MAYQLPEALREALVHREISWSERISTHIDPDPFVDVLGSKTDTSSSLPSSTHESTQDPRIDAKEENTEEQRGNSIRIDAKEKLCARVMDIAHWFGLHVEIDADRESLPLFVPASVCPRRDPTSGGGGGEDGSTCSLSSRFAMSPLSTSMTAARAWHSLSCCSPSPSPSATTATTTTSSTTSDSASASLEMVPCVLQAALHRSIPLVDRLGPSCERSLQSAISLLDRVRSLRESSAASTERLHAECSEAVQKHIRISQTVSRLEERLASYRAIATLTKRLEKTPVPELLEIRQSSTDTRIDHHVTRLESGTDESDSDSLSMRSEIDRSKFSYILADVMEEIDHHSNVLAQRSHHRESSQYLLRFRSLQSRCLALLRNFVTGEFERSAAAFNRRLVSQNDGINSTQLSSIPSDGTSSDASVIDSSSGKKMTGYGPRSYDDVDGTIQTVKLQALARRLTPYIRQMESRTYLREYTQHLHLCVDSYIENRKKMLSPVLRKRMEELQRLESEHDISEEDGTGGILAKLVRDGCMVVLNISAQERKLMESLFPISLKSDKHVQHRCRMFLEEVCTELHSYLRPLIIRCHSLQALAAAVTVLQSDVVSASAESARSQHENRTPGGSRPLTPRTPGTPRTPRTPLGSARSSSSARTPYSFRSNQSQRSDASGVLWNAVEDFSRSGDMGGANSFAPTVSLVLADAQERLVYLAERFVDVDIVRIGQKALTDPACEADRWKRSSTDVAFEGSVDPSNIVQDWHPALLNSVWLLNRLFQSLETSAFLSIAQDTVSACQEALSQVASALEKYRSVEESHLFLIAHILALRDQLSVLPMDLVSTSYDLDFRHVRDVFGRILRGDARFLVQDGIWGFATHSGIEITESSVDSKRDLDRILKLRCESFVLLVTRKTAEDLLSLISSLTNVKNADLAEEYESLLSSSALARVFSSLVFHICLYVRHLWVTMTEYLRDAVTRGILARPIRGNIIEAYDQVFEHVGLRPVPTLRFHCLRTGTTPETSPSANSSLPLDSTSDDDKQSISSPPPPSLDEEAHELRPHTESTEVADSIQISSPELVEQDLPSSLRELDEDAFLFLSDVLTSTQSNELSSPGERNVSDLREFELSRALLIRLLDAALSDTSVHSSALGAIASRSPQSVSNSASLALRRTSSSSLDNA